MTYSQVSHAAEPLILTVPGLGNSGPDHWQTYWEEDIAHCHRVNLGMWDAPHRNTWVNKLNHVIAHADRPIVLVAHSLGCLTVAWWAALERPAPGGKVIGALLVAPPEVDTASIDPRVSAFGPAPKGLLPFPSVLVASRTDPYIRFERARMLAGFWGSEFVDAGEIGHINAQSGLGRWEQGQALLGRLTGAPATLQRSLVPLDVANLGGGEKGYDLSL
ncbi:RBBP9/YdeN family alpha/beta hydrolase [Sphingobium subterraneum]|uniref:Esterase n=1 Tax=Sphingobium subterraneum TaxID=627688 RepID=A0A841J6F7_9SPHN|nr:alpha/beta hydrolase [Sphingobium subterraneum]MBB6125116.1 hypothetical protein [Sphingobium subterraneum]